MVILAWVVERDGGASSDDGSKRSLVFFQSSFYDKNYTGASHLRVHNTVVLLYLQYVIKGCAIYTVFQCMN